jgi:hypothetical protein
MHRFLADTTYETIDDKAVTNNGDTDRVLATVAFTIYAFYKEYPECKLIFIRKYNK